MRPGAWRSSCAGSTTPRSTRCAPRWSSRATSIDLSSLGRHGRRQALDRRRRRQGHDRARAARGRVRRAGREDVGPRARPHGRHARQARGDPRASASSCSVDGVRAPGRARSAAPWSRRPTSSCRPTACSTRCATSPARCPAPGLIATSRDVEEARRRRRRDPARRQGRRRRVLPDRRGGARAGAADARHRHARRAGRRSAS